MAAELESFFKGMPEVDVGVDTGKVSSSFILKDFLFSLPVLSEFGKEIHRFGEE